MTERYLAEVPQVLPFVLDKTTLPVPCTELDLLGLDVRAAMIVRSFPVGTIDGLSRLSEQELKTPGSRRQTTPTPVIDEIHEKIAQFNAELRVLDTAAAIAANGSPRDPVVINARDWFEQHSLTWTGIPKTPVMLEVEEIVGEELGTYLEEAVSIYQLSTPRIAEEVERMSGGRRRLRGDQVRGFFTMFNIEFLDMNKIRDRRKGAMPENERERVVAALNEAPRTGRMNDERLAAIRLVVGLARQNGLWDLPLYLSDKDRIVLEFVTQGVQESEIARVLAVGDSRIDDIATQATRRLRTQLQRQGMITGNVLDTGQVSEPALPMLEG